MWRLHVLLDMKDYVTFCSQATSKCIWHRMALEALAEDSMQLAPTKDSNSTGADETRVKLKSQKDQAPPVRVEASTTSNDDACAEDGEATALAKTSPPKKRGRGAPKEDRKGPSKLARKRKPQPQLKLQITGKGIGEYFVNVSMDEKLLPHLHSYCNTYMKNVYGVIFKHKGARIGEAGDTARTCGMTEGAIEEVTAHERLRISVSAVRGSFPIYILGPREGMEAFCYVEAKTPVGEILWYIAEDLGPDRDFGHHDVVFDIGDARFNEDDYESTLGSLGIKKGDVIQALLKD